MKESLREYDSGRSLLNRTQGKHHSWPANRRRGAENEGNGH
jgi:hypothetical protein